MVSNENMLNYKLVSLVDVIKSITNGTTAKQNKEGFGYRVTRIETISNGNINILKTNFVKIDQNLYDKFILYDGDILFSHINSTKHLGKTAIYTSDRGELIHGMNLLRIVPDNSVIIPKFLLYLLKNKKSRAYFQTRCKKAVNQSSLDQKTIKKFKLILPPLETQKKIVEILEKTEKLKELRAEADKLADDYLESVFLEMFGDPIKNEKGWRTLNGEDYCKKISVGVVIKPASYYVDEGIIALRSLNIKPNRFNLNDLVYFSSEDHFGKLSKSILKQGDVVLVRTGLTGTAAVIPKKLDGSNCIDLIIASPNKDLIHPVYLAYFFNSENGKNLVLSKEVGGIQKHFNVGAIKKLKIPIPPLELQNQFAQIVQQVETLKTHQSESKQEIDNLFNTLMQKAFKGELVC